jgi:D-inositol-3-phosphate glycosyltransferase
MMHHYESKKRLGPWRVAMLCIHSSPDSELGRRNAGGMSVYVQALAQHLGAGGHHIDIFTCEPGAASGHLLSSNVRLIRLQLPKAATLTKNQLPDHVDHIFKLLEVYRRDQRVDYDIIHSHYWISGQVGAIAQREWNCPHIIMFHTLGFMKNVLADGENEPPRRIHHERQLMQSVQRIIVPTPSERDNMIKHYAAGAERIRVIPCGVDLERFQPMDRMQARQQLNLPPSADIILFVGRFAPLKGLDRLVKVVARLKDRHPLRLVIVGGEGPEDDSTRQLNQLVQSLDLQTRVRLEGPIEHGILPRYYSAADALVMPSQYESFGLVVLEAMACGTPVLASPVGAALEVIRRGGNGMFFKSTATVDLAAGLESFLAMPVGQRPTPNRVRHSIKDWEWKRVGAQMQKVYGNTLATYDP